MRESVWSFLYISFLSCNSNNIIILLMPTQSYFSRTSHTWIDRYIDRTTELLELISSAEISGRDNALVVKNKFTFLVIVC